MKKYVCKSKTIIYPDYGRDVAVKTSLEPLQEMKRSEYVGCNKT